MKKVSVVSTCYNEKKFIKQAIESVLSQTVTDHLREIIVVNDGSTDGSTEMLNKVEEKHDIVKHVKQNNEGLPSARNTGIKKSSGEYIAFIDGDDVWRNDKIEKQVEVLNSYESVGLVYSDAYISDKKGEIKTVKKCNSYKYNDKNVLRKYFQKDAPIYPSSVIVRKKCLESVGCFRESLLRAQDTDLWFRIIAEYPIHHLPEPLIVRRDRDNSLGSDVLQKSEYLIRVRNNIVDRYPHLKPYRYEREGLIFSAAARHAACAGLRIKAIRLAFKALYNNPYSPRNYAIFGFVVSPIPSKLLNKINYLIRELL